MADTTFGVNHPMAVKLWSRMLHVEVLKQAWASKFIGSSPNSLIQVKDETKKSKGDKVTYGLRMMLNAAGISGDASLEGNEESLTVYSDSVTIDQLRHAVRSGGRISEQRVPFEVREEARDALADWFADRLDASWLNQVAGNVAQSDTRYTGMQAVTAPDSDHIIRINANEASDQSISTTSTFTLAAIDKAVERARTLSPAIRPLKIGGKPMYAAFLHEYQVYDLRTNTATGQWLDLQKSAMQGGEIEDNPIFDGCLSVYNGVIMHCDVRVPQGVNSSTSAAVANTRRAVFCGAQAAVMAYGRDNSAERYTWVEETFDYKNKLGVAAGTIMGLKKTVFNSTDFATVVMATYAAAH